MSLVQNLEADFFDQHRMDVCHVCGRPYRNEPYVAHNGADGCYIGMHMRCSAILVLRISADIMREQHAGRSGRARVVDVLAGRE